MKKPIITPVDHHEDSMSDPETRLKRFGVGHLTDLELADILVGLPAAGGHKREKRTQIALDLLALIDRRIGRMDFDELQHIAEFSEERALILASALELTRRKFFPVSRLVETPLEIYRLVSHMSDRPEENFLCITLNGAQEVIQVRLISRGILNRSIVHPREVFADAIGDRAAAIVIAHNHPSGNVLPSDEDEVMTERLVRAGRILGIPLLDHIVFAADGYFSFLENGRLGESKSL